MSKYVTIARPYAKAAFEYAVEKNRITQWNEFLQQASLITQNKQIITFIQNPEINKHDKLRLIEDIFKSTLTEEQRNLLSLLNSYNRLLILPAIAELFDTQLKIHENIIQITLISATTMLTDQQKRLQKALEIRLGKQVRMNVIIDKTIIGGVIVQAGDLVIDGSIHGKLNRLQKALLI